jgi:glycerol-3-phosphate O-acyltransferase/dihydroxyacetone phosphate acyltransferase
LTRLVSASKARQAVVKSSVKIHGRDVAATWKVLVALVLLPVLWVTYTWLSGELVRELYRGGGSGG